MRRKIACLVILLLAAFCTRAARAEGSTIGVHFDASRTIGRAAESGEAVPASLEPFVKWVCSDPEGHAGALTVDPPARGWSAGWVGTCRAGLGLRNTDDTPLSLRIETRLPTGLWRVDAVLVSDPEMAGAKPPLYWRMESVLQRDSGIAIKSIPLGPHQALFIRWTETGGAALEARRGVRKTCWETTNSRLQDEVGGALTPVGDILDALPVLVARGDRDKIAKRIHTAPLAAAKAQAIWDNGRGNDASARDTAFSDLVTALSEISCADFNLVPSQTSVDPSNGGAPILEIGLTNAGGRTVTLVSLGIENQDGSGGSDRIVFRAVAPGATVTARFPAPNPAAVHGVVQFLSDMGLATVPAAPPGP